MSYSIEQNRAKKRYISIGVLCQRTGYSRKHLNRLADQGKIPGCQPRATSRSHWRFEDGPELRKFVRELKSVAMRPTAAPKPVRRYVREAVPAPLTPPRNGFAAAVRQLKSAHDAYARNLACLIEQEEARVGVAAVSEILREEGVASSDVERAKAVLGLTPKARQELSGLTDEHAIAVCRAKQLTSSKRTRWLQQARKHGLTAYELQASIGQARVVRVTDIHEQSGHNSGFATMEGVIFLLHQWRSKVRRARRLENWNPERKQRLSQHIKEAEQLLASVKSEAQLGNGQR